MRQPLVAGNWKMNGSRASVEELLEGEQAWLAERGVLVRELRLGAAGLEEVFLSVTGGEVH